MKQFLFPILLPLLLISCGGDPLETNFDLEEQYVYESDQTPVLEPFRSLSDISLKEVRLVDIEPRITDKIVDFSKQ